MGTMERAGLGRRRADGGKRARSMSFTIVRRAPRTAGSTSTKTRIGYHASAGRLRSRVLIFQGRHDESVSPAVVERFAAAQPQPTLHMLDDGHQLKNSLPFIWEKTAAAFRPIIKSCNFGLEMLVLTGESAARGVTHAGQEGPRHPVVGNHGQEAVSAPTRVHPGRRP